LEGERVTIARIRRTIIVADRRSPVAASSYPSRRPHVARTPFAQGRSLREFFSDNHLKTEVVE
jgi:hypothetical protein